MKINDLFYLFIIIVSIFSIIIILHNIILVNADSNIINIKILSIENVGNNLEVNTSFIYANGTPYTGSVALKSTAPPGFQPSTQDWEYIPENGLKSFVIQNRQLQNFDSITIYAEPSEKYNTSWYYNTTWNSPLDNTTVNQTINQSDNNTTVDIDVNSSVNSSIPVIIISNDTNSTIIINTNSSGIGNGSITINDTDNIQTIINGKVISGTPSNPNSYKGYKSVKSTVYHKKIGDVNDDGISMINCGTDLIAPILIIMLILILVIYYKKY